jgi:hypothetical protein
MPPFQAIITGGAQKRKSEPDDESRKRLALDGSFKISTPPQQGVESGERYWMVQW